MVSPSSSLHFFLSLLQDVIEKGKPVLWSPSLHKKVVRVLNGNKVEDKVTQFLIAILECIANNILRVRMDVDCGCQMKSIFF